MTASARDLANHTIELEESEEAPCSANNHSDLKGAPPPDPNIAHKHKEATGDIATVEDRGERSPTRDNPHHEEEWTNEHDSISPT